MPETFNESHAEQMVLNACQAAGWKYIPAEQLPRDYGDVLVDQMVKSALIRLNPCIAEHPAHADTVIYKLRSLISTVQPHDLVTQNERFKKLVFEENSFPFAPDGRSISIRFFDYDDISQNEFVVTNQWVYPYVNGGKRLDVVLLINGFPVIIGEMKSPTRPAISWVDGAMDIGKYEKSIPNIPVVPGTYTFKETYAPSGYALNVAIKTFTVTADGKVTGDTVIRDDLNRVELKKTKDNGEPLPGAVFGLFDAKDTKIQEATSKADGSVVFTKIPYGSYTIRELSAPYGYHPSEEEWKVDVDGTYVNPTTLLATVENQPAPGRIKILKQDELDKHVIAGVQFDIFTVDADGNPGDLVAKMTTGKDGIAESPDLFPADYIVREHANPTGYVDQLWSEKITVGMDEIVTRTVTNMPVQGKIRIVKTDSETGKGLPGAVFTVTRISGLPSHNGENDGEIVAVITSGADGTAETPLLTWGEYQIVETRVPDDYLDDGYSVTVRIPAGVKTDDTQAEETADPVK